jgi:hypothetical protein
MNNVVRIGWRSIETLPDNGETILLFCEGRRGATAIFVGGVSAVDDDGPMYWALSPDDPNGQGFDLYWRPTHWMPAPAPPRNRIEPDTRTDELTARDFYPDGEIP